MDHFTPLQLDAILKNASNVKAIISTSTSIKDAYEVLALAKKYPKIKASLGLYPQKENFNDFSEFKKLVLKNLSQIIQIGEIGMDFCHETKETQKEQEKLFKAQLELAEELNLPVSIHARSAEKEVLDVLENYPKVTKILHCFCGNMKQVARAANMACYFSITTALDRMQNFQKALEIIPKNKILTETDAPYLSPQKYKDLPNEAAYIEETIKQIAKIWGKSVDETEKIIEENTDRIFNF